MELALAILLAPLLVGVIRRVKAAFAGRAGPPLLQAYRDAWKLAQKSTVYSATTTWVFRAGPVAALGCAAGALALVPTGGLRAPRLPARPVPVRPRARGARHGILVRGPGSEPRGRLRCAGGACAPPRAPVPGAEHQPGVAHFHRGVDRTRDVARVRRPPPARLGLALGDPAGG